MEEPGGLMGFLEERLEAKGHAVVVVAEGAGQEHLQHKAIEQQRAADEAVEAAVGAALQASAPPHQTG